MLRTIKEIKNLEGRRVLVRTDFNVPLRGDKIDGNEAWKIERSQSTIKYLIKKEAKVILASHLGRPKGAKKEGLSLKPVAEYLSQKLGKSVLFLKDWQNKKSKDSLKNLRNSQVVLLENLRFNPGEEKNSVAFAKTLAELGEVYVNDAFAVCHRPQASVIGVPKYLPTYAGLLLAQEVKELSQALAQPKRPLVAIIGGVKISSKILTLNNFLKIADLILVGGALANNFLKAIGYPIGKSIIEKDYIKEALELLNKKGTGSKIIMPIDVLVGGGLISPRRAIWHQLKDIESDEYILDIGPKTRRLYCRLIKRAKTVIWNGPLGYFENKHFRQGTYKIAKAVAQARADTIVGGGETVEVLKRLKLLERISFVSTGGGAMLEFLGGKELPGLKPLVNVK